SGVAILPLSVILRLSDEDSRRISIATHLPILAVATKPKTVIPSEVRNRGCQFVFSLTIAGIDVAPSRLCAAGRAVDFFALFVPAEDGFADSLHRALRHRARFLRAFVNHFEHARGMPFEFHAALAYRRNPLNQMVGHFCFALDAADSRRAATVRGPVQGLFC